MKSPFSTYSTLEDAGIYSIGDKDGNTTFTLKLLDNEYLLLGDDRIVSKDSRQVGAFKKEQIKGQAVFRLWPIYPFKTY